MRKGPSPTRAARRPGAWRRPTLFLDEIGNLPLPMQAKLLTALEKRVITRLGGTEQIPIDVRLICATNAQIRHEVEQGRFRQDLLYRINTIELRIPPLRERGEDILLLAEFFLGRTARKYHKAVTGINREARQKLMRYAWPGNVRELEHAIERAVILTTHASLRPGDFILEAPPAKAAADDGEAAASLNLEQVERQTIAKALKRSEGNLTRAAEYLGITRYALYRKMEKLGL